MSLDIDDLNKFTLEELKDFADGEGIEYKKDVSKKELLAILLKEYDDSFSSSFDDDDEEDEDEEDLMSSKKKKKKYKFSSYFDDDDEDAKKQNIIALLLNLKATIIQLRRRLLGEEFNKKKGVSVQIKGRVPLVSKRLGNEIEAIIISICNPQVYISGFSEEDFRLTLRRNLFDFNDKLLNSPEIGLSPIPDQIHNDILNIFWNLVFTNLKVAYNGEFKEFFSQLEIGAWKDNEQVMQRPQQGKGILQEAGEYLTT